MLINILNVIIKVNFYYHAPKAWAKYEVLRKVYMFSAQINYQTRQIGLKWAKKINTRRATNFKRLVCRLKS